MWTVGAVTQNLCGCCFSFTIFTSLKYYFTNHFDTVFVAVFITIFILFSVRCKQNGNYILVYTCTCINVWNLCIHLYTQCIMSQYQFSDEERRKEFLDLLFAFLTLKGTYSMYMYMYIYCCNSYTWTCTLQVQVYTRTCIYSRYRIFYNISRTCLITKVSCDCWNATYTPKIRKMGVWSFLHSDTLYAHACYACIDYAACGQIYITRRLHLYM